MIILKYLINEIKQKEPDMAQKNIDMVKKISSGNFLQKNVKEIENQSGIKKKELIKNNSKIANLDENRIKYNRTSII